MGRDPVQSRGTVLIVVLLASFSSTHPTAGKVKTQKARLMVCKDMDFPLLLDFHGSDSLNGCWLVGQTDIHSRLIVWGSWDDATVLASPTVPMSKHLKPFSREASGKGS